MIDGNSGIVHFDDPKIDLSANFDKKWAEDLCEAGLLSKVLWNKEYELFNFNSWKAEGQQFAANISLQSEKLVTIQLVMHISDEPISWSEWNEEIEIKRKGIHDSFLAREFGKRLDDEYGAYSFRWGKAQSIRDPREGTATILISYRKESLNE